MGEKREAGTPASGAVETTVQKFLGLDDAEMQVVELRVRIAKEVRRLRAAAGMSQEELAERVGSTQPRISSIEAGASASFDAVLMTYFAAGGELGDLASVVAGPAPPGSLPGRLRKRDNTAEDEEIREDRRRNGGSLPKTG